MTVAQVYDIIKIAFETLRKDKILTREHLDNIVKNNLIPQLLACDYTQNGMSGKKLLEKIVKDDTIHPQWGDLTDKIIHELMNRGMKELTINGIVQPWLYVNPAYVKRPKRNWLRVD
jgi:hypothetical protein